MTASPAALHPAETQAALVAALREVHGPGARLEAWTADPLTRHGRHRVVRYDVAARVADVPPVRRCRWVGKFYDRDEDARRVTAVLRELAVTACGGGAGVVVPSVIAYDAPARVLLLTYESGRSLTSAIAREGSVVLAAVGRALAVLHAAPVTLDAMTTPAAVLDHLRPKLAELCARFPGEAARLRDEGVELERAAPPASPARAFLHGDLGTAQLLWNAGAIIVLDFDDCTRGDPALDLGNLLTQLRRLTLRKPGKLPDLASLKSGILDAYQRCAPPDPGLARRVAWYERVTLLEKIHSLAFDRTRRPEAEAIRLRQAEAIRLLEVRDERAT
jgi:aminoglycoside phosphotransferase (APT) family kinase protein